MAKPTVFISYNWAKSERVDTIEKGIEEYATVVRDKNDIEDWHSLSEFMKRIRKEDFAVLCISDEYLKSINCMYEVSLLMKDDDWVKKLMSLRVDDTTLYDSKTQAEYILYWDKEKKKLEDEINTLPLNMRDVHTEKLKKINEICSKFSEFIKKIIDLLMPNRENAVGAIISRIIGENILSPEEQKKADEKSLKNEENELMKIPFGSDADTLLASADRLMEIATIYKEDARNSEAMTVLERILKIREKLLGVEHPDTANTYNNIASVYCNQSEYTEALKWHNKALAIREKVHREHPNTASTYNNIAGVYDRQGEYTEALKWYNKALAIREKVLGVGHPSTASTYNNIALVYHRQGEYTEALKWHSKALAICEKVLGVEHPDTATTYNNIAYVYHNQGKYTEALEWYNKALAICEKLLGAEHPNTKVVKENIATCHENMGS